MAFCPIPRKRFTEETVVQKKEINGKVKSEKKRTVI